MKIKEIINYEWNKKSEDKSQERIIKILVYNFYDSMYNNFSFC